MTTKHAGSKARSERKGAQEDLRDAPEKVRQFLWFLRNWRRCWRPLLGFAFFVLLVFVLTQMGANVIIPVIRHHFTSVTIKVVHFDHATGGILLEFNNTTEAPVPVESLYITISPTNNVPMNPLPEEWQRTITVFDKFALRIPPGAGVEIGPVTKEGQHPSGRPVRMAIFLFPPTHSIVLPPGYTTTNVVPTADAFAQICRHYAEGAQLEVLLHTSLVDTGGRSRIRCIPLGSYFIGKWHTGLKGALYPKAIDVLRKADIGGTESERMAYSFSGTQDFPSLDKNVRIARIENPGPVEMLLRIVGEGISGYVPVVLLKKSIAYGCRFSVEVKSGERLPPDFGTWVLTCDEGKTVMNVPMAFASGWADVLETPALGKEYTIPLPSTNWQVLIGGSRWAKIREGAVIYTVKQQAWQKLLPANDASASALFSNFNRIAILEAKDDPSWVAVTGTAFTPTNTKAFLTVQNEVKPDWSLFSSSRWAAISNLVDEVTNSASGAPTVLPDEHEAKGNAGAEQDKSSVHGDPRR